VCMSAVGEDGKILGFQLHISLNIYSRSPTTPCRLTRVCKICGLTNPFGQKVADYVINPFRGFAAGVLAQNFCLKISQQGKNFLSFSTDRLKSGEILSQIKGTSPGRSSRGLKYRI